MSGHIEVELRENVNRLVTPTFKLEADETTTVTQQELDAWRAKIKRA